MTAISPARSASLILRRLRCAGVAHPEAATLAIAARASTRLTPVGFATEIEVPLHIVEAAEAGRIDLADLPPQLRQLARDYGVALHPSRSPN